MFDDVSLAPNPPDKVYIVTMLIPVGSEYKMARSSQYLAYTRQGAKEQAIADNPTAIVTDIERVKDGK